MPKSAYHDNQTQLRQICKHFAYGKLHVSYTVEENMWGMIIDMIIDISMV